MLAVYLSPLYILLNLYLLNWIYRWTGALYPLLRTISVRTGMGLVYGFVAITILLGMLLPQGRARRIVRTIGNYWLGITLYLALTVSIADVIRLLLSHCDFVNQSKLHSVFALRLCGTVCLAIIVGISAWGVFNAHRLRVNPYRITVKKDGGSVKQLRVVLAADLHLGSNVGCTQMERMVHKINACDPDLVVFAGDIFDNDYDALDDDAQLTHILRGIRSRYGVYACYGNHDVAEKILAGFTFDNGEKKVSDPRMDTFLQQANIRLLQEEGILIEDSFYLYGRPDAERPGRGIVTRKTPQEITENLDRSKPILVLDHEPRELQELADAGVDVDLCGHTHDGQIFPANLITSLVWENACGWLKKDEMHNIVTSGAGLFGPNMRVGTKAEICDITIDFQK
jgi:hypothetical protein